MNRLIFVSIFIFTLVSSFAKTSVWKVEKNGKTIYLGGTIHILKDSDYPLPSQYDSIYKLCDELVFETDGKQLETPQGSMELVKSLMYSDESTLKTVLNEKAYKQLSEEYSSYKMELSQFDKFKPSFAVLTLTMIKFKQIGLTEQGIDKFYEKKATKDKKKLSYLESNEEQINFIANMGKGDESNFVISSLKDLKKTKSGFESMTKDWRNGSGKSIDEMSIEMKNDYRDLYTNLLLNRNNNWIPKIEAEFNDEHTEFILVGSAHLYGKDSVINKLKSKGYKITQL